MSPENTTTRGRRGEDLACRHLESHGLALVLRNYRCRAGEIDLVMLEGATLVLIEVRLRTSPSHGGAAASIDRRKQQRFVRAARHLLLTHPRFRELAARFDVVAIDPAPGMGDSIRITWIKDAFRAS